MTMATRLLVGGFALSLAIIAAVSAFLMVSRNQQTSAGAESNAQSRAQAFAELIEQVAAPQARFAARNLAGLPQLASALGAADPRSAVGALLTGPAAAVTDLTGDQVAVFDPSGALVATGGFPGPALPGSLPAVQQALRGSPAEAIDVLAGGTPAYDFAAPVRSGAGRVLGAVAYSVPLPSQSMRLVGALGSGYTPVLVVNRPGAALQLLSGTADNPTVHLGTLPAAMAGALGGQTPSLAGFTTLPGQGGAAIALQGVGSGPGPPPLYVGVVTPVSLFAGTQTGDELTLGWLALTALLVTWLLVLLFVNRFVRRPVAQLSDGVARIAGGDYSSDIPIRSHDELAALAAQVNRMRAQIESNVRHIDHAVTRLDEVSRALTTTTSGVSMLRGAVCAAAASIAGREASAWILERHGEELAATPDSPEEPPPPELPAAAAGELLAGRMARFSGRVPDRRRSLAIPMSYRGRVSGAILVSGRQAISDADARALSALANNAAIALENTRLFERERETLRLMRELDGMKSDFLATAQHELRTPLTAILGHLELMRMVWAGGDEREKLGILDNIELAAGQLSDLLETMIDLSLVSADNLRMHRRDVALAPAVRDAAGEVERRLPHGLPVQLHIDVPDGLRVDADPERLRQVVRCLLDNAVKFTPAGGRVEVRAQPSASADRCIVEVTDTGIGIEPALHERVFDRFFQADSGGTRSYGGMGVGLALVKMLVEAHGGGVSLSSAPGAGTTVRLEWPCPADGATPKDTEVQVDLTGAAAVQDGTVSAS
jgi:signal transduction histidine kinase/HAMP domain-containing protein